ncbi:hypothetical protein [Paenibacillus rhizophilus]|uniref:Uncharacterized protein n=1 Tax=Paenibacillus rhizophilus TaxID=1850366 RepID=A0A3N9P933_9BACL|nr:hypothetical protein [Paenibacillus rhizophilus]RQW11827.1 hypothetical protein EH198_09110 [Paenibacillus rhizophilus]
MDMKNMKVVHYCWTCGKSHEATDTPYDLIASDKSVKCECGGYVVSPSGKVQLSIVPAVPIWKIDDGAETFRVAASNAEEALKCLSEEMGLDEIEEPEVREITDAGELRRKFILVEEGGTNKSSIIDIINRTEKFPALISTSIW